MVVDVFGFCFVAVEVWWLYWDLQLGSGGDYCWGVLVVLALLGVAEMFLYGAWLPMLMVAATCGDKKLKPKTWRERERELPCLDDSIENKKLKWERGEDKHIGSCLAIKYEKT